MADYSYDYRMCVGSSSYDFAHFTSKITDDLRIRSLTLFSGAFGQAILVDLREGKKVNQA